MCFKSSLISLHTGVFSDGVTKEYSMHFNILGFNFIFHRFPFSQISHSSTTNPMTVKMHMESGIYFVKSTSLLLAFRFTSWDDLHPSWLEESYTCELYRRGCNCQRCDTEGEGWSAWRTRPIMSGTRSSVSLEQYSLVNSVPSKWMLFSQYCCHRWMRCWPPLHKDQWQLNKAYVEPSKCKIQRHFPSLPWSVHIDNVQNAWFHAMKLTNNNANEITCHQGERRGKTPVIKGGRIAFMQLSVPPQSSN